MNDKQLISLLKRASYEKKLEYITESVKAKLIAKKIGSKRSVPSLSEAYASGLGPSMDVGPSTPPSSRSIASGRSTAQMSKPGEYPDPEILSSDAERLGVDGNSELGRFSIPTRGAGTYAQLIADYEAALEAAQSAARGAMSIDELVANFLMPGRPEEDRRKLRSAAARLLRSARK